ncbi:MAG: transporter, family, 3-phenylpropionic acid transporter [Candidatus Sumerlaeota bacterium]|nr:transporter, family, 3-phenylpropionic acid transporter [Candidatus Sumerlaeota bacterium]
MLVQPTLWVFSVVALTFPFWPLYFQTIGLSESQIGYLWAVGALASLFSQQFWGYLADVRYNIKWCMIVMSVGSAAVSVVFPVFTSFAALVTLMTLFSALSTARIPMVSALILDNRGGEERYGPLRTWGTVIFIVVLFGTSWLVDRQAMGIGIIFPLLVVANVLCALTMIPVKGYAYGSRRQINSRLQKLPSFVEVQKLLLSYPVIRAFIPFMFFTQLPHNFSHMMLPVLVRNTGAGDQAWLATLPIVIGAASEMVVFLTFLAISRRIRLMPLLFLSAFSGIVRWSMIALSPSLPVICLSAVLHMMTYGMLHMCSVVLVNRELPAALRSSGQTLLNILSLAFGLLLGSLLSGIFLEFFSLRSWYAVSGITSALALPFWFVLMRRYNGEHGVHGFFVR